MFSPSLPATSTRSSSSDSTASGPFACDGLEHASSRTPGTRRSSETGSVSQPTATIVPCPSSMPVADEALGRRAAGTLGGLRHALLAQERAGGLEVAARLLERALAVHHRRAGGVAKLLDLALRNGRAHAVSSSVCSDTSVGSAASRGLFALREHLVGGLLRDSFGRRLLGHRLFGYRFFRCGRWPRRRLGRCGGAVAVRNRGSAALGQLLLGHLRLAGGDPVGDRAHDQAARADRVVVAGDDVVGLVRIAVRVDERDDRHAEPARLAHGELLLLQVDDEDGVRLPLQVGDAAEVRLELLELRQQPDPLLRGQELELALGLQPAQLVQVRDPVGDRPPVGQQAAEPAVGDERHPDARPPPGRPRPGPASSCRRTGSCRRAARCCGRSRTPPRAARRSGSDR